MFFSMVDRYSSAGASKFWASASAMPIDEAIIQARSICFILRELSDFHVKAAAPENIEMEPATVVAPLIMD